MKLTQLQQRNGIDITARNTQKLITQEEFEESLEAYFKEAKEKKEALNVVTLAFSMGLTVSQFRDLEGIIQSPYNRELQKRALTLCESDASQRLIEGKPPIGLIFYLKNVFNWKDKREEERTFNIKVERVRFNRKDKKPRKLVIPMQTGQE